MQEEHKISDEIRLAVSENCPGVIFRTNAGSSYAGKVIYSDYYGCNIIKNPRPVKLLPKGFPDLIYIGPDNTFVAVEVKTGKGRVSDEQSRFHGLLKNYDVPVCVARTADDAVSYIQSIHRRKKDG